jgi:hypothetical protein
MLEDAVYYSRREAEERRLAVHSADPRARTVHRLLADKYSKLAHRMMAEIDQSGLRDVRSN